MSQTSENSVTSPEKGLAVALASVSVVSLVSICLALFLNWGR